MLFYHRLRDSFVAKTSMTLTVKQKIIFIFVVILTLDIWIELFIYFVYSVFKLVEFYLEILVQQLFGVAHHISEIIVFYFFFFLAFCGFVYVWFLLPRLYAYGCVLGNLYKLQFIKFWNGLAVLEKVKLSATSLMMSSGFIFYLFL